MRERPIDGFEETLNLRMLKALVGRRPGESVDLDTEVETLATGEIADEPNVLPHIGDDDFLDVRALVVIAVAVKIPAGATVLDDGLEAAEAVDDGFHVFFQNAVVQLALPHSETISVERPPVGIVPTERWQRGVQDVANPPETVVGVRIRGLGLEASPIAVGTLETATVGIPKIALLGLDPHLERDGGAVVLLEAVAVGLGVVGNDLEAVLIAVLYLPALALETEMGGLVVDEPVKPLVDVLEDDIRLVVAVANTLTPGPPETLVGAVVAVV